MQKNKLDKWNQMVLALFIMGCAFGSLSFLALSDWGFYAHRLINRLAVYTLPPEMMVLYKPNIDYLSDHAVDPDKRRYASPFEAMRHYIDLEPWGVFPYDNLPRTWTEAVMKHTDLLWISNLNDSIRIKGKDIYGSFKSGESYTSVDENFRWTLPNQQIKSFYQKEVIDHFYDEPWSVPRDSFFDQNFLPHAFDLKELKIIDSLTHHGILPFHLAKAQTDLTQAFIEKDVPQILRRSAEIGHYIGDAHVPLHTTENYNGQLTNQIGIHAFWESRIPELFAESEYDFLVGKPTYISDPVEFYWDIVLQSHSYVDSVLFIEKDLSDKFDSDRQFCFDERLSVTVRTQCREYAQAYHRRMAGMVEERMQAAIRAIASAWYTAWIDAGQPKFGYEELVLSEEALLDSESSIEAKKFSDKRKHE